MCILTVSHLGVRDSTGVFRLGSKQVPLPPMPLLGPNKSQCYVYTFTYQFWLLRKQDQEINMHAFITQLLKMLISGELI